MSLTIFQIENAKPQAKPYKLFDGKGLYIEVAPTGARWWRFKYRIAGKNRFVRHQVRTSAWSARVRATRRVAKGRVVGV